MSLLYLHHPREDPPLQSTGKPCSRMGAHTYECEGRIIICLSTCIRAEGKADCQGTKVANKDICARLT